MYSYELPQFEGNKLQAFVNPEYKEKYFMGGDNYYEKIGTSFLNRDSEYMQEAVAGEKKYTDQELSDLYYNLGMQASGGVGRERHRGTRAGQIRSYGKREGTGYAKPQEYFALTEKDLIDIGKAYSARNDESAGSRLQSEVDAAQQHLDWLQGQNKTYTGTYAGRAQASYNESMGYARQNAQKNFSNAKKELERYQGFQSDLNRLKAGETIERSNPYEEKVFDRFRGWVAPVIEQDIRQTPQPRIAPGRTSALRNYSLETAQASPVAYKPFEGSEPIKSTANVDRTENRMSYVNDFFSKMGYNEDKGDFGIA